MDGLDVGYRSFGVSGVVADLVLFLVKVIGVAKEVVEIFIVNYYSKKSSHGSNRVTYLQ